MMTVMKSVQSTVVLVLFCLISQISLAQHQIHVDHAPQHGIFIDAPEQVGIIVDSAMIGAQVIRSQGTGVQSALSADHGIRVWQSGGHGILVDSSQLSGVQIEGSVEHGLKILRADLNGIDISEVDQNGIHIEGAQRGINISGVNEGVRVSGSGGNGLTVENPFHHGIEIIASGQSGAYVRNTESQGIDIRNTGSNGIRIRESGASGVRIDQTTGAGVFVTNAGQQGIYVSNSTGPGIHTANSGQSGIHIVKPQDEGAHIYKPGSIGVWIDSSGADGIYISAASDDGLTISDPADDGINVINATEDGIHVNGAGSSAGLFVTSSGSTDPSVYITHSDDDQFDLQLGGDGKVQADGGFEIHLDGDNANPSEFFKVSASDGTLPMVLAENGDVAFSGHLSKGSGSFKIDHPLDPQNKYLYHSFVESPDMMNIYNGNTHLNDQGEAVIEMPDWFEPLNRDFRYQLTAIGGPADLFIKEEITDGRFKIAGGDPGMKVSWQVTGIRQDRYANTHRLKVEVEKEDHAKGTYLHPEVWQEN